MKAITPMEHYQQNTKTTYGMKKKVSFGPYVMVKEVPRLTDVDKQRMFYTDEEYDLFEAAELRRRATIHLLYQEYKRQHRLMVLQYLLRSEIMAMHPPSRDNSQKEVETLSEYNTAAERGQTQANAEERKNIIKENVNKRSFADILKRDDPCELSKAPGDHLACSIHATKGDNDGVEVRMATKVTYPSGNRKTVLPHHSTNGDSFDMDDEISSPDSCLNRLTKRRRVSIVKRSAYAA